MRIVITGHKGQLGRQLQAAFAAHDILGLDMPEDDITAPAIRGRITAFRPDLIVHAAAYTDVDGCEANPDLAFRANAVGTQNIALTAARAGAGMVYISTNEVFDGSRRDLYREWDVVSPISVYARSKAAGEQIVRDLAGGRFYICRVAWLFGPGGNNFVMKILAGAEKHGSLKVAADEFGNPTYAPDVAAAIASLVTTHQYGIYHLTNAGFCSRHEFAQAIMRLAGKPNLPITPILSADWPRPSKPPLHAILANTAAAALGITLRPWQEAVAEYVRLLTPDACCLIPGPWSLTPDA
jgi:dTDP-4-dehydrorhamnose reductase